MGVDHLGTESADDFAQTRQCAKIFEGRNRSYEIADLEFLDIVQSPRFAIEHITRTPGQSSFERLPIEVRDRVQDDPLRAPEFEARDDRQHSEATAQSAPLINRRAAAMPSRMASSMAEYFHSAQRPQSRMSCDPSQPRRVETACRRSWSKTT